MIISPQKAKEAAAVLAIELEGLSLTALATAYRSAAKTCHPDHHAGMAEQWARVSWARAALEHWLKRNPPAEAELDKTVCVSCNGTGRVAVAHRGFGKTLTMQCDLCNGLGANNVDREKSNGD